MRIWTWIWYQKTLRILGKILILSYNGCERRKNMSYNELKENEENKLKSLLKAAENKGKNKTRKILVFLVVFAFVFCFMCIYCWYTSSPWNSQRVVTVGNIAIALLAALFLGVISILMLQYLDEYKIETLKSQLIGLGIEDAKKNVDEDIYQNLIKISYKYLDEYYLQTRQQAQKGFFVTVCVAIAGAIIVAIGIIAMFFGKTTPAYVTTASGTVTEFIAAVFFYLYNKTIASMSDYHNKLVLSQNVSIALKISESMTKEQGEKVKEHIVEELMKDINTYIHSEN